MIPRVLIAAPTSDAKDYCFDEWIKQVRGIDYPRADVFLVDNSIGMDYFNKLLTTGVKLAHMDRTGRPEEWLTFAQNVIREFFLKGQYDFLWMLETDVLVDKGWLERALSFRVDVFNTPYFINVARHRWETTPCVQVGHQYKGNTHTQMASAMLGFDCFTGEQKHITEYTIGDMSLMQCGLGCSLIHRSVLSEIEFKFGKDPWVFADSVFHVEAIEKGFHCIFDTSYIATHNNQSVWSL